MSAEEANLEVIVSIVIVNIIERDKSWIMVSHSNVDGRYEIFSCIRCTFFGCDNNANSSLDDSKGRVFGVCFVVHEVMKIHVSVMVIIIIRFRKRNLLIGSTVV